MFSENEKISGRQLYRAIVVTLAGPTLLICPKIAGRFGADGFFVYLIAGVMTVLYVGLMLRCKNKYADNGKDSLNKRRGKFIKVIVRVVLCLKLLLLAMGGLYLIGDVVSGILLPETHLIMILLVVAVALVYWNQGSIESSGRAFEIIFYWVLVPIIFVVAIAAPKISVGNLKPSLSSDVGNIALAGVLMWILFTPAELLALCGEHYRNDKKTNRGIWRGVLMLFAGNVITYSTILGIYGGAGMNQGGTYPLLKVMQISGIPGDFLRRVDGFMSVFLVLSLFCGMVMLLDYLGISLWQIGDILFGGNNKESSKFYKYTKAKDWLCRNKKIIFSFVVTGIMVAGAYTIEMKIVDEEGDSLHTETYSDKKVVSGTELEDRGFVMSVIIGKNTVTFEIASDSDGAWKDESNYVTLRSNKVWEAEKLYRENGNKRLDFTHMKMIFLNDDIYEGDIATENLKYMYEKEKFAENILVCCLEGDTEKMAAEAIKNGSAFAAIMEEIMVNSNRSEAMELYRVYLGRQ